ncbi:MAG: GNAT family N-acetyltransferase [Crocinitomicaceae bacterium]|nr:GNAT family N-acetyltransferase [Crocinitomicaceae bacterium]
MNTIFENLPKEEIMKLLGHRSDEAFQKEAHKQKNGYASYNRQFVLFLLLEKNTGIIIGRCGLHNWSTEHKRAEIGYHLEEDKFKQKGFMTEAVEAILNYGFEKMELHRIEALVGTENIPSLKIMEHFGFIKEGLLREHWLTGDQFGDTVVFSKLKSEF